MKSLQKKIKVRDLAQLIFLNHDEFCPNVLGNLSLSDHAVRHYDMLVLNTK